MRDCAANVDIVSTKLYQLRPRQHCEGQRPKQPVQQRGDVADVFFGGGEGMKMGQVAQRTPCTVRGSPFFLQFEEDVKVKFGKSFRNQN